MWLEKLGKKSEKGLTRAPFTSRMGAVRAPFFAAVKIIISRLTDLAFPRFLTTQVRKAVFPIRAETFWGGVTSKNGSLVNPPFSLRRVLISLSLAMALLLNWWWWPPPTSETVPEPEEPPLIWEEASRKKEKNTEMFEIGVFPRGVTFEDLKTASASRRLEKYAFHLGNLSRRWSVIYFNNQSIGAWFEDWDHFSSFAAGWVHRKESTENCFSKLLHHQRRLEFQGSIYFWPHAAYKEAIPNSRQVNISPPSRY